MTSGAVCLQCIPLLAPAFGSFALNLLVRTLAEWLDQRERERESVHVCVYVYDLLGRFITVLECEL
jgi:hypothetical protein